MAKTKVEIIDEILAPYIADPSQRSSTAGGNCLYNGPDGRMCAFARACLEPEKLTEFQGAHQILNREGIHILKPEYRHIGDVDFWGSVQCFHDTRVFFDDTGLSDAGEIELQRLKTKYRE